MHIPGTCLIHVGLGVPMRSCTRQQLYGDRRLRCHLATAAVEGHHTHAVTRKHLIAVRAPVRPASRSAPGLSNGRPSRGIQQSCARHLPRASMMSAALITSFWNFWGALLQPVLKLLEASHVIGTIQKRKPQLPQPVAPQPASSTQECDVLLQQLQGVKQEWVHVNTAERAHLLQQCIQALLPLATDIAQAGASAKGQYESGYGEELTTVLPIITALAEYRQSILARGQLPPLQLTTRPDGQQVALVWPRNMIPAFFPNFTGEVWIQPGQPASQGALYRDKAAGNFGSGHVALVLGAGNQLPVVALDVLHKLLAEDEVVLVKMNPVNDYLGPLLAKAFGPLVARGVLRFAYGGPEVGKYLVEHPLVETVHLTGSEATYNSIVWGSPTVPATGAPRLTKPVTAELGNVTPFLIVPGEWSAEDLLYQAENVASGLVQNTSHNCIAAEVLLIDADWPQRAAFLSHLAAALDQLSQRAPWYPGALQRYEAWAKEHPGAAALGRPVAAQPGRPAAVPWLLATGLSPDTTQLRQESWCGVLKEIPLTGCGGDAGKFLGAAVKFANERCWGTLGCSVFIHPATAAAHAAAFDAAVSELAYGSVCINIPVTTGFAITPLSWGAFPGHTATDIGSGVGWIHNTYLFDHPQKSVLRAPWVYYPRPLWSAGQTNLQAALPWSIKYILSQDFPPVALVYLLMTAVAALRGSVRLVGV